MAVVAGGFHRAAFSLPKLVIRLTAFDHVVDQRCFRRLLLMQIEYRRATSSKIIRKQMVFAYRHFAELTELLPYWHFPHVKTPWGEDKIEPESAWCAGYAWNAPASNPFTGMTATSLPMRSRMPCLRPDPNVKLKLMA
jgi:hypothetical protein